MAVVPSGTFGPHLALTAVGPFAAWAEPIADGVRWRTMAPGTKARLRLGPTLPSTTGMLAFFKLDRANSGAVLAQVTKKDRIDTVSVTLLKPSGAAAPQEVSAEEGEVLWVASAPEGQAARVVWARRQGAGAEISTAALDGLGALGPREVVRRGSIGWQLAAGGAGVWLATLEGSAQKAALVLTRLDAPLKEGRSIEVARDLKGADQVDLWVGESTLVLGIREGDASAPRLHMAEVDAAGTVSVPLHPITPPRGPQSLLRLLPSAGSPRPWLAWEEPALDGPSWRRVLFARLGKDGTQAPEAWLDVHDEGSLLPGVAEASGNVVALTRGEACEKPECGADRSGLSLLAFGGAAGGPAAGTPLVSEVPGLPAGLGRGALCWDLDCLGADCAALCADTDTPTSVHFASFTPAKALGNRGVSAAPGGDQSLALRSLVGGPRLVEREPLSATSALSDLTFARSEERTLLSWVTDFDPSLRPAQLSRPAADGRLEPYQAELRVLCLERPARADRPRVTQDTVVSRRARSLGGVSLSGERAGRRVLGWAALDQGRAHVFATLLDAQGKKLKQRMLGRNSGEVTDVQVVATPTGFLLLWVDDRSGRGQVYAQAVDGELNSVGPERTLTTDTTAPIGLSVLAREDAVVLAYADGKGDQSGSISVMSVTAGATAPITPPRAISEGEGHAHSPVLFVEPKGGLAVMFVQQAPPEQGRAKRELRALALDSGLRPLGKQAPLLPGVDVDALALDCDATGCRLLTLSTGMERGELWAAASPDGVAFRSQFVLALDGSAEFLPAPALHGTEAYVVNPSGDGGYFVERLVIDFGQDVAP